MQRLLLMLALCGALVGCRDTIQGKSIAEPQVGVFHERLNDGRFEEIYATADKEFQQATPKDKAIELFSAITRKLGRTKSSTVKTWNVGTFNFVTRVVLVQETVFEKGQGTETFTFKVDGDKATLLGYNINSLDMMTK